MAVIRYRKNRKRWVVDWREAGVRYTQSFKDRQNAKEFLRLKEDYLGRRRAGMESVEPIPFADYAELFIENHFREKSERYLRSSCYRIRSNFVSFFKDMLVCNIDRADVVAFRNHRRALGRSAKTVRNDLGILNTMFKKAIDNGFAFENPVEGVEKPRNTPKIQQVPWTDEEFRFVMRNAQEEVKRVCLVLYNTGMRMGELAQLKKSDFDLRLGVVRIKSVEGATTKTYRARVVPLPDVIMELIPTIPCESILSGTRKAFEHQWYTFKSDHKFERTLHQLRHTYISRMLKAGVDKKTLMEWVGQKTSGITDHYTHMIPEQMSEWREKVNRGVNVGQEFISESHATVQPMWRPNGDHLSRPKKIPSKYNDLEGIICSGGGICSSAAGGLPASEGGNRLYDDCTS